ncbi:MAG: glutamine synthetase [Betaproteobacteria bacterium]|nr:glutamine synthetase [Betaproteobacteria bacterium]
MRAADVAAGKELRIAQAIILQTVTGQYPDDSIIGEADGDARLIPDMSTLRRLPWSSARAWLIHDCVGFDGAPIPFAPRNVLKRVLERYRDKGWQPVVAPELEFYLFARDGQEVSGFNMPAMRGGCREVKQSAYSVESANELKDFWTELYAVFEQLEISTDTWLHEMGPSQFEINLFHGDPLVMADQVLLFKYALREVAAHHGLYAVFMAKPLAGRDGSSMHLHQSIVDAAGNNIFSQADGEASAAFYAFIGGSQRTLPDCMPLFAPHLNSWRRYVRGKMAPINMEWGENNRTIALRVPLSGPAARRVENRVPGSDANPYLAMAASLACGLYGIEHAIEARAPIHISSGYSQPREIPRSLESALERFQASAVAREMLGDVFVDAFCSVKDVELDHGMNEVSEWDRRYLTLQT